MPSRHIVKPYVENGVYHIYNRGVEKRDIFLDAQDYTVFLRFLKDALDPPLDPKTQQIDITVKGSTFKGIPKMPKNFHDEIELFAYCLMPNHFHLLVKQSSERAIKEFLQSVATRYSVYFNKKYKRVGSLFQGIYKAILVTEEPYLLHLTRYIHRNPLDIHQDIKNAYSSYRDYLGIQHASWVKPQFILSFFSERKLPFLKNNNSYKNFVENTKADSEEILGTLTID